MRLYWSALVSVISVFTVALPAFALDKVDDPYVEKDQLEIDYAGTRTQDRDGAKNNIQGHEFEIGYGLTDFYQLELGGVLARDAGGPSVFEGVEIENKFQFTKKGEMWADTGLIVNYQSNLHRGDADGLQVKFLAEKDIGNFNTIVNLGFEQGIGHDNNGGPDVAFLWNSRYQLCDAFAPGIEMQSDFGQTNVHTRFEDEQHLIGPSMGGTFYKGETFELDYEAAYLFGFTPGSPDSASRVVIAYERQF